MQKIDAHAHFIGDHPRSEQLLEELDLKMLNVCVVDEAWGGWRDQARDYADLARTIPHRYAWCTSFDLPGFDDPDYADRVIEGLDRDFDAGAVACKVWKNIGMQLKNPDGDYVMVDDPVFEPIFAHLTDTGRTALMHLADPVSAWGPQTATRGYYVDHPEWCMYGKSGAPSHADIMDSRDRLLERHPDLRVVAGHLGSMEHDLSGLGERLRRFPNLAAGIGGRTSSFAMAGPEAARQFILEFQDRVLFGTDMGPAGKRQSQMPAKDYDSFFAYATEVYRFAFEYYESSGEVAYRGKPFQGLALDEAILEKLYRTNALRWYPGV